MGSQNINNHVIFITLLPRTSIRTRKHLKTTNGYLFIILIHSSANITALKKKCSLLPLKDTRALDHSV